ncbi:hypothetical protein NBRC110019_25120 [Neptunitalea chrysea]|uniref:Uncharacterized protein n=1 Tax=Neptunitalea chrysea TaxID=1647581 RepID=A0A9W6B6K8_9FLAO|nr:hypothetical protein [Neptunitalea chrysea]GLB53471.1 hypothetical protein NBRC110019_25120 [Neptunitalea chrysea]
MRLTIILLTLFVTINVQSQANDFEGAAYNIGIGSVFSSIGAIINKKEDVTLGATIKKSLWQGAVGGYINFEAKRLLRKNIYNDQWYYYWAANTLNCIGSSITENAAYNRGMFEQLNWHIAFMRLEFKLKNNLKVHPKFMLVETGSFLYNASKFNFEAKQSLKTGHMIFSADYLGHNIYALHNAGNILVIKSQLTDERNYVHEIIHRYQRDNYIALNSYYTPSIKNWLKNYKWGRFLNNHTYLDFHNLIISAVSYSLSESNDEYYDNMFEHEAGYYSHTLYFYNN